jgi:hypothetical protein
MDNNKTETTEIKEGAVFGQAILNAEIGSPLYLQMARHFADEMFKAVNHGRICTPERMAGLYPIFREINVEMDEINLHWREKENRQLNKR